MTISYRLIMWDWKDRIDLDDLNDAIKNVYDGQHAPRIHQVDTGQDCFAIVVASHELTPEEAQTYWDSRDDE